MPSVDLEGRTVLPALCDVHTHPSWIAATVRSVPCVSPIVNTIEEMIEALRRHPLAGRGPEAWITGFGYDEGKLAEHRTPTIEDLDRVSTTQPVFVKRSDCHSAICNSVALRLAGIEAGTPDPAGGRFGRFPDGRPNGVLTEFNAAQVVERLMGQDGRPLHRGRQALCRRKRLGRHGGRDDALSQRLDWDGHARRRRA